MRKPLWACVLLPFLFAGPAVEFERVVIDPDGPGDIWLKSVGDLNGDKRPDLIAGGHRGGLVWYENPSWKKHFVDAETKFSTDGEVADVDRNGMQDIVALTDDAVVWYSNPSWTVQKIDDRRLHDIEIADLDKDGKVDIVGRNQGAFSGRGDQIFLYKQESPTSWKSRIQPLPGNGEGLKLTDIDADGDFDIVIEKFWLENTGDVLGGEWPLHEYGNAWTHPHTFVATGDIDGDGRIDIILSPAERELQKARISWFEAPKDRRKGKWIEHIVEADVESVHHFVGVADFNKDGRQDIATAEMAQGQKKEVRIYVNAGRGEKWERQVIANTASHSMRIVDVNGDGFPDLYGANWRSNIVELWRNGRERASR